jgi:hypothetical protein
MRPPLVDIGFSVGRLVVVAAAPSRRAPSGFTFRYWRCACECGAEHIVRERHLVSGRTRSCGCLRRELAKLQKTTHGGRHTLLYDVWTQMLQRCENQKNKRFARYGGRGVEVCDAWRDFAAFERDVREGYEPGLQIDRIDNDGPYAPGNVRWATNKANNRNRTKVVMVVWQGRRVPLNDLAEQYGIKKHTLYSRHCLRGWPLERALTQSTAGARWGERNLT